MIMAPIAGPTTRPMLNCAVLRDSALVMSYSGTS